MQLSVDLSIPCVFCLLAFFICQSDCPHRCQSNCPLRCQSNCPLRCQSDCPLHCQSDCPLHCQSDCPLRCQSDWPLGCQSVYLLPAIPSACLSICVSVLQLKLGPRSFRRRMGLRDLNAEVNLFCYRPRYQIEVGHSRT